jgi:ADP-ribose pyrophosphatase YjhB (NUDIX family)
MRNGLGRPHSPNAIPTGQEPGRSGYNGGMNAFPDDQTTRDFTVATFVVHQGRVLLLWHRKLQMWLPPGGHIEPNELPDEAAVREVREEAGLEVELVGERGLAIEQPRQLVRPFGIQLEDIAPGHQHVDLIYFARPTHVDATEATGNAESEAIGWFTGEEMRPRGVNDEVRSWATRAIQTVGRKISRRRRPNSR